MILSSIMNIQRYLFIYNDDDDDDDDNSSNNIISTYVYIPKATPLYGA